MKPTNANDCLLGLGFSPDGLKGRFGCGSDKYADSRERYVLGELTALAPTRSQPWLTILRMHGKESHWFVDLPLDLDAELTERILLAIIGKESTDVGALKEAMAVSGHRPGYQHHGVEIRHGQVRIGVDAPKEIPVTRSEMTHEWRAKTDEPPAGSE